MSTSLENINSFKMTLSYISIAEMAVALGLVTSRCGSNKHAGAHKMGVGMKTQAVQKLNCISSLSGKAFKVLTESILPRWISAE